MTSWNHPVIAGGGDLCNRKLCSFCVTTVEWLTFPANWSWGRHLAETSNFGSDCIWVMSFCRFPIRLFDVCLRASTSFTGKAVFSISFLIFSPPFLILSISSRSLRFFIFFYLWPLRVNRKTCCKKSWQVFFFDEIGQPSHQDILLAINFSAHHRYVSVWHL